MRPDLILRWRGNPALGLMYIGPLLSAAVSAAFLWNAGALLFLPLGAVLFTVLLFRWFSKRGHTLVLDAEGVALRSPKGVEWQLPWTGLIVARRVRRPGDPVSETLLLTGSDGSRTVPRSRGLRCVGRLGRPPRRPPRPGAPPVSVLSQWRPTPLAAALHFGGYVLYFGAFLAFRDGPRWDFLLIPILFLIGHLDANRGRTLVADGRGVRLLRENDITVWRVAPDELREVRREGDRLTLVTKKGRRRTVRLGPSAFGAWTGLDRLEAALPLPERAA